MLVVLLLLLLLLVMVDQRLHRHTSGIFIVDRWMLLRILSMERHGILLRTDRMSLSLCYGL